MLSLLLIPLNLTSEKKVFYRKCGQRCMPLYISHSCVIQLITEKGTVREVSGLGWWLFEDNPAVVL